ncbi:MAG: bifunctional [glutamate--ammonia ligase]-adenylyl-L-tyrosine phosphorylase/[glutamate--ammonia-ligase] adenylyltransferase [Desulfobacteraceae bacterium]|nr:bifunctional [glutamate--ammonia ligase]-adenylyl-L-tyrosine phosphorylase/[glutamate--ammonia-ligase] adenylyltransferase [Desulfobacteraceae bacterium]
MDSGIFDTLFLTLDHRLKGMMENRTARFLEALEKSHPEFKFNPDPLLHFQKILLFSEFIAASITRWPKIAVELLTSEDLFKSFSPQTIALMLDKQLDQKKELSKIKQVLIETKLIQTIRIAWRDLAGLATLTETLEDLSSLADACVDKAMEKIYQELCQKFGTPVDSEGNFQQIVVLGMGKLGAKELNFSSDIDLIFVYPEQGYTNQDNMISNQEFFIKLCRKFLQLFDARSHETNFYRVDTRLRPFGESGPLVMDFSAFEEYYQAQGRDWERYAMIKARPIAGDIEQGNALLEQLKPFIYRRYFDYSTFDSFRDMKARITAQIKSKKLKNNIKLGSGGIREIEFFGQIFQLIRGGVEPKLQEPGIVKVLDLLYAHGLIDQEACNDLKEAYSFLRLVENRLQEYADLQTHDLPENVEQQIILALSMGFDSWEKFKTVLEIHLGNVHTHFNDLLVTGNEKTLDDESQSLKELWVRINDPQVMADTIAVSGFEDPKKVLDMLRALEQHPNTKQLTPNGRKKLSRLVPLLVKAAGKTKDPETVLSRLVDLIITIERRTTYLSLLIENKGILETLVNLAQKSTWIILFLSSHPVLLDELMHPQTLYSLPKKKALQKELSIRMERIPGSDIEYQLEELCIFMQINTLRVAAADISGNYPLMKVSDHLTWIAETILDRVLKISWNILIQKYGNPQGIDLNNIDACGFAIVVYGKVGGLEMGYASDVDLVFLYDSDSGSTVNGKRSIENIRFYSNLGQRIINILTMHTRAGKLYGADMRLRPGGTSGMIVSHIEAFEEYMEKDAWTWEHQAVIRARPVSGDKTLFKRFNTIREKVLQTKRDPDTLEKEVTDMRERMRADRLKPQKGLFDLKQDKAGIVDIEFFVQYLILKYAHDYPDITYWTDNVRLLEALEAEGIITGDEGIFLREAYIMMRKKIHSSNLKDTKSLVPESEFAMVREKVLKIFKKYLKS